MSNNLLHDKGAIPLLNAISPELRILDLSYNPGLTQKSYQILSDFLIERTSVPLQELNLEGNLMGNSNAILILDSLAYANRLTYLNLCKNDLTDQVAPYLKTLLELNSTLLGLLVGWNKFTSKGGLNICDGLIANNVYCKYWSLDISFNALGSHPKRNINSFKEVNVKAAVKEYRESLKA